MFETLVGSRRSCPAFVFSLAAHAFSVVLLVVPALFAVEEPPEPEDKAIRDWLPPAPVTIAGGRHEAKPIFLRKRNRGDQDGPRRAGVSALAAPAPQSLERKNENEAPPVTQPQDVPSTLPPVPDAPSLSSFEARERSERIGTGGRDGSDNERGEIGYPDGCEGCPPGPVVIGPNVVPPVALATPEPQYPQAAFQARLSGSVVLEAIIGVDGSVRDVRVLRSSSPLFEAAAIDAVRRWRYVPARIGSRRVSVFLTVNVTFTLRS